MIGRSRACPASRETTGAAGSAGAAGAAAAVTSAAFASMRSPPRSCAMARTSASRSIGLVMKRSQPASSICFSKPAMAFAVSATIGVFTPRARSSRVAP
jgi:hypothetical protein